MAGLSLCGAAVGRAKDRIQPLSENMPVVRAKATARGIKAGRPQGEKPEGASKKSLFSLGKRRTS